MNEEEKGIEKLNDCVFNGNFNQITIDFTEEVYALFQEDVDDFENPIEIERRRNALGAMSYDINNVLHIINPELKEEIKVLKNLSIIIDKLIKEIERIIISSRT